MGKCQPAKIARSEQRLLASRWKLAGGRLLMSLQHLHGSSRFRLSTCCGQTRTTGRGERGGKEWASGGERRQRVARESADLEPAAVCPFCFLPGSLRGSTPTSRGGIWGKKRCRTAAGAGWKEHGMGWLGWLPQHTCVSANTETEASNGKEKKVPGLLRAYGMAGQSPQLLCGR